jgi:hypothetical protein
VVEAAASEPAVVPAVFEASPEARQTIHQLPPAPEDKIVIVEPDPVAAPPANRNPSVTVPSRSEPIFSRESLSVLANRRGLALPLTDANIVVYKGQRRLDLRSGATIIKSYRVGLGANPTGDKTRQGDSRTPEGEFLICTRNSTTSSFHIFLGLNYPTVPDAERGLQASQIDRREFDTIRQRLLSGQPPLWETKLGGWIGIHGGTDATFAQKKMRERGNSDWTAGCIAVTDAEIEEIHAATRMYTRVLVLP